MKSTTLILLALLPLTTMATESSTPTLALSEDTRKLLKQEMQQIKIGMQSLVLDIASADWEKIATTGHNIKHSYIMKKQLSKQQMHELHTALPETFQSIDQKFHYYAGMMSHAAKEHDIELVQFYRYKMNESCTACHAHFAREAFSGFNQPNKHQRHMH